MIQDFGQSDGDVESQSIVLVWVRMWTFDLLYGLTDIDVGGKSVIGPHVIDTAETALALGVAVTVSHTLPTGTALSTVTGMTQRPGASTHTLTDVDIGGKAVIGSHVIDATETALTLGVAVTVSHTHPTGPAIKTVVRVA